MIFSRDDYIPLLETCPSLASALLPTEPDKYMASSQKKITYVGNTKIDGQRIIWLEQISNLRNTFAFQYVNFWGDTNHMNSRLAKELYLRRVPLKNIHITVDHKHLEWQHNETYLTELLLRYSKCRLTDLSNKGCRRESFSHAELDWANRVWHNITNAFHSSDVAVFANGNEISLNIYIRAARFANVRQIIVEMSHWDPSTLHNADIDVIVVPSMYLYKIVRDHLKLKRPFFPSQASHGMLVQEGVRSSQLCHISPSAGDMVDYKNPKTIKREGRKKCSIGVVSRVSYEKNLAFFITVASVLKFQHNVTCKYVIIGDGPAMASLQLLAIRLNVEEDISFLGFIESKFIPRYVSEFDIFFNPSVQNETFCIANIEAMALGIPVIGFGLENGSMEYMDDTASVGIEASAISSAIDSTIDLLLRLLKDDRKRIRIGQRGKKKVKEYYSKKNAMLKYRDLFLAKPKTRAA